ncbi:MAG TPA: TIGR03619 family F420-dependent LLM class oxidoreductase [Acidimicrobiia bacterium]|nr:TIGR03619 family F420-dependent LLM class oxidoreductase [Acidimicrobiia bacterium]
MTARLSVALPTFAAEDPGDWTPLLDRARAADDAGIDRVLVSDHVVFGENLEAYGRPDSGGVEGGRQPTGPDGHWLEPLTVLTAVAALTERVRLGTYILLAALRRPVVLAKQAATLDVLSRGRLDLGVGIGWQREEYETAGLDFAARGRLLDHSLDVCRTLWRDQRASFDSPELRFDAIHAMPKPLQAGGVPIWVSGRCNERVARRLARFGSGWLPWGDDDADLASSLPRMRAAVDAAGGSGDAFAVMGSLRLRRRGDKTIDLAATMDPVPGLVESGVTDFRLYVPVPDSYAGARDTYTEIVAAFRETSGQ